MGKIIIDDLNIRLLVNQIMTTIIICGNEADLENRLSEFEIVDVNQVLVGELVKRKGKPNHFFIDDLFHRAYSLKHQSILLKNFGILFDPEYKLDVMKFFEKLNSKAKVVVEWPGKIIDNKLIYGDEQFEDYASYNVSDYNITVVVERGQHEVF